MKRSTGANYPSVGGDRGLRDWAGLVVYGETHQLNIAFKESRKRVLSTIIYSKKLEICAWGGDLSIIHDAPASNDMACCLLRALRQLSHALDVDPDIRSGVPVLRGTRIPVSQILVELADDERLSEVADDLEIDRDLIATSLHGIASLLDSPLGRAVQRQCVLSNSMNAPIQGS
ncbi:MAG: DUF433 domain-containing protein [Thermoguttaceae bacterium]|jgi:uncharacterized protein (DUF433 family)